LTYRTDFVEIGRTNAGVYTGRIARIGLQHYEDGYELRPESEVFSAEALASFDGVTIRVGHDSFAPTVGYVRNPRRDGDHVLADLEIFDAAVRRRIGRGELNELSCGYDCELDHSPGTMPDGRAYYAIQRQIRGDHLALLPPGHARCGATCAIHPPPERIPSVSDCSCDSFSDPRFPGKSRAYVDAYVAAATRSDDERAARGLPPAFADVLGVTAPAAPPVNFASPAHSDATTPVRASSCGMVTQRRDGTVHVDDSFFEGTGLSRADIDQQIHLSLPSTRPSLDDIADAALRVRLAALARAEADAENGTPRRVDHEDGLAHYDSGDSASFSAHLARRARQMYRGDE
jgi:hypothetical protein